MNSIQSAIEACRSAPSTWLVTGVAGFIGSNLLESLLKLDQRVIGLDNFATGKQYNLDEVKASVAPEQWARFTFIEGSIEDLASCRKATEGVRYVLHHAALGSVPASIVDPVLCNAVNVSGFVNMLVASREAGVQTFVYAASSSTYGDEPSMPKREEVIGKPLSPYAVSKYVDELYADVFTRCYGMRTVGLRYFNIFGPRQDPNGAYAAVIPKWIAAMLAGQPVLVNGDGENTRDYCHVDNVVQANLLAATAQETAVNQIYNIALGQKTSLNGLHGILKRLLQARREGLAIPGPQYGPPRFGDILHSQADISKAAHLLGFSPQLDVENGLRTALDWYIGKGAN